MMVVSLQQPQEGLTLLAILDLPKRRSETWLAALVLTRHNPVQIAILDLLVVLILCKVEVAAGQVPVQEPDLLRFAHSLQMHLTVAHDPVPQPCALNNAQHATAIR